MTIERPAIICHAINTVCATTWVPTITGKAIGIDLLRKRVDGKVTGQQGRERFGYEVTVSI